MPDHTLVLSPLSTLSAILCKTMTLFQSLVYSISPNLTTMPTSIHPPPPPTPLSALSNIISSGLSKIESTYASQGVQFPSLDSPDLTPTPTALDTAEMSETLHHVIAAAAQLIATLRNPQQKVFADGYSQYVTSTLGIVCSANIPEILREAGPQGLHTDEIALKCGNLDSLKIGRVLRFLATHHYFHEVAPDVFANNRLSAVLDTGKSVAEINANPSAKHDHTSGTAALVENSAEVVLPAGALLRTIVLDPHLSKSPDPKDSAFCHANNQLSMFEYFEVPGNEYRRRRFGAGMHGLSSFNRTDIILDGFDWKALKEDSLVVDIGGGVGSASMLLNKAHPHLKFAVLDRPAVIPDGENFWKKKNPEPLQTGRVTFQAYDFFETQPIKGADVYFLRYIVHDWPDDHARRILKQARLAAEPHSKLIIVDKVISYALLNSSSDTNERASSTPYPLLGNLGAVSLPEVGMDLQMMTLFNGQERTVGQFVQLARGTGWELDTVSRSPHDALSLLVFNPVSA